jgi:hypothetical protein
LAAFDVGEDIIQHTDTTAGILCACRERHDVMNSRLQPLQAERWFSAAEREMQAETFAHP